MSRPSSCTALVPPFSNCAIVGMEDDDSDYYDIDSGGYDEPSSQEPLSPPTRNVRAGHSLTSVASIQDARGRRAETEPLPARLLCPTRVTGSRSHSRRRSCSRSLEREDRVDYDLGSELPEHSEDIEEVVSVVLPHIPATCEEELSPLAEPHLLWHCTLSDHNGSSELPRMPVTTMLDIGSPFVLIMPEVANRAGLKPRPLHSPIMVGAKTTWRQWSCGVSPMSSRWAHSSVFQLYITVWETSSSSTMTPT
ncbi:hypothetical protein IW261DRAFT_1516922 [Armillaria novae-zelandiae]|uniref:Uncharacterized protein n=1 Tax=Armillaria novae-zelandiae TaxID=153914 RepID=A0AA39NNH0_9AGAR|nr:hypothetical protein IW261DRAFT_1516922 [Armillaria novae-zelandiae]